ncbi:FAD-dependent oxidoreductase [Actinomadura rupiterrae]|uniref:FAD-dependent oxidoreductase n=1 Tax=Actinomadura rupiterrae TaxID=559627 RepID=UPI0020A520C2|nr:GMC family oxidoreductase [Actinomadura rupiterrae]MCP2336075.1 choline dehydrogenase-like flavoprotein [Actinomadura rupiterrae]
MTNHPNNASEGRTAERTDVLVIGSGFGGAIAAYHLAAGGADVTVLERGPWVASDEFEHDFLLGSSYTRIFDFVVGEGMSVLGGNCVGGGSVVYFAAMPRAPRFVFERRGNIGRRMWPSSIDRDRLDPWYDRVAEALPIIKQDWNDVTYSGGVFAAACAHAGLTANPAPAAIDRALCTNCNWMMSGCRFDAKRSLLLNYLPAAVAHGATIRPLHEVQHLSRNADGGYRVHYNVIDEEDYRVTVGSGAIDAKLVVVAAGAGATPVILRRSEPALGPMPYAVGRYFSGNGERLNTAVFDEEKVRTVLGLDRGEAAYAASQIGKGPCVASWDRLDPALPEYSRFTLEQLYFPPGFGTILAQVPGADGRTTWFGPEKKELLRHWQSWLTIFTMSEDDNEGVFGAPPPTGNATRISQQMLGRGTLRYEPSINTMRGWAESDAAVKDIMERDGLARVLPWTNDLVGAYTVHPLASCRIGDDPSTSALDDRHELRGHPGIFVTDGSAVPGALTVNPAFTLAALAERAMPGIVAAARERGVEVTYGAPSPEGETSARRAALPLVRDLVRD